MKVVTHKPKSKWHSPNFTIRGINRETLTMMLLCAIEGARNVVNDPSRREEYILLFRRIEAHINHSDTEVRDRELEI